MTDGSDRSHDIPLERPHRLRPPRGRRLIYLAGAIAIGMAASIAKPSVDCEEATRRGLPAPAALICRDEYRRTGDPATGVLLAYNLRLTPNWTSAKVVATALLETSQRADAFRILGQIAQREDREGDAITALETARELHQAQQKPCEVARDNQILANIKTDRHEYADALSLLHECITDSHLTTCRPIEYICRLSASRTLMTVGHFELARNELETAAALAVTDKDHAQLALRWGSLEQALDHNKQAAAHFRKVIALNEHIQMRDLTADAELNLAYSLAQWGNLDEAERQLEHVTMYLVDDPGDSQRLQIAARIAYRRGDRTQAWSLNQKAWPHVTDIDQQIHVANMQAEIALANGDFEQAEIWADRGAKQVETIAMGQSAIELRAWAMSSRRAPYELLFIAQARRHRVEDAVMTIARWQGRALLDALARSNHRAPADLRAVATELSNLGEWLPAVSAAPIATLPSLPALLDTLQSIDLLALVVADGDVWRVAANHGSLALDRLGPVSVLKSKIIAFCAHPTDPRLAEDLGELLLPDELFRATREPLHVLLDEQLGSLPRLDAHLGSLPVAALRRHGAPLITSRPVVRILRLPEGPCVQAVRSGRATVLADAAGNLPKARQEGDEVAAHLHTTAAVGRAVTSKLLLDAERDAVLHIAGHTTPGSAADTLELDREVSALEISARSQGPSLVFLSACESGSSESSARGGSLAAAFLAAGSQQVVATLRRVSDQSALDLSMQFYRAGGVQNPVQALALVQASLSKTADNEWPLYAVFGYNVCTN